MILTYTQMMANVIFMVLAFGINPFFGILIASIIFYRAIKSYTTSGLNFTYDSDMGRIRAVREDTISRLKDMNISSAERQRLISAYDDIEEMLNMRREYDSLVNMILDHLVPGQLKIKNDILFQKELEGIVNNPLYASAIRTLED